MTGTRRPKKLENPDPKAARRAKAVKYIRIAKWRREAIDGTDSLKRNTVKALAKAERRLRNSMAYIVRPRNADLARWRTMEAHIATLKASLAKMGISNEHPRRPLKLKAVQPVGAQPKARFRNTANPKPEGGPDATS
jgi:hypothetical protein